MYYIFTYLHTVANSELSEREGVVTERGVAGCLEAPSRSNAKLWWCHRERNSMKPRSSNEIIPIYFNVFEKYFYKNGLCSELGWGDVNKLYIFYRTMCLFIETNYTLPPPPPNSKMYM